MRFLSNLFRTKEAEVKTEPITIYCPLRGKVIALGEIPDQVFSAGVLGIGFGIEPVDETIYAPFNGTIVQVSDTKHALGILSKDEIELLIHVGMDTVDMNGKGFEIFVKEGDEVVMGQPLMKFNIDLIKKAGHLATTAIIVTNSSEFSNIALETGNISEVSLPLAVLKK